MYVDADGKFLPFSAIERKLQTSELKVDDGKYPKLFLFDILAVDRQSLCHLQLSERRKRLEDLVHTLGCMDLPKETRVIELAQSFLLSPDSALEE